MGTRNKLLTILYLLGSLLLILSIILFIPLVLSLILNEGIQLYKSYIVPILISLITGFIFNRIKIDRVNVSLTTGMIVCGIGWFVFSMIGGIPFKLALNKTFVDALFEAVSGFTTTGITVFTGLDQMPKSILLWRGLIQWVGGLGILTFFLLITFRSEGGIWQLFTAEAHKIDTSRPVPNIFKSVKILWLIYLIFTILELFLLVFLDVSFFNALIHSLTSISTGGFSTFDSSITYFQQSGHPFYKQIEYIIIIFMILGGTNFLVHYKVLTGDIKEVFTNSELKYFWSIMGIVFILILAGRYVSGNPVLNNLEVNIRTTLFQIVSIITTTGYETRHIGSAFFTGIARQLFLFLMLVGGCVGSTSGGIKVIRFAVLNRLFLREIKKFYYPERALIPVTLDKKIIPNEELLKIAAMFFAWLLLILIGGGITVMFSDLNAFQSLSGMFSAVGNIGPFYFSVDKMISLSPVIKITYIFGMLAGRLEILPVLLIFTRKAWK